MRRIILFLFFSHILFNGCSPVVGNKLQTFHDLEYKVADRGMLDVIVLGRACASLLQDAISGAKRTAEFHLRSVVGNQNHRKKFQEVDRYYDGDMICVEMSAAALPPL